MKKCYFLFPLIGLLACQHSPEWRARCYARYMEDEGKLMTKIEIREVGQKEVAAIELDEVRFNDGAMEHRENNVVGHYYQSEVPGELPSSGFEYRINHQKEHATIRFNILGLKNIQIKEQQISKTSGFTLTWDGPALGKNEEITVTITDMEGTVAQAVVKGATAKTEAFIPAAMYSGLKPGASSYFLVKTMFPNTENDNISSEAEVGYYSKNYAAEVTE